MTNTYDELVQMKMDHPEYRELGIFAGYGERAVFEIEWGSPASLRACAEWNMREAGQATRQISKAQTLADQDYFCRRGARLREQASALCKRADAMDLGA